MNILFDIGHPGQVHLFRFAIQLLQEKGHKVVVTVKDIKTAKELLNVFGISWYSLGRKHDSIFLKGFTQLKYNFNLYRICFREKIDIAIGSSITISHVSFIHKMKSIVLDDDDTNAVKLFSLFAHPFADCILSPDALNHDRQRKKDITYAGTHELFYLHPSFFIPEQKVIKDLKIEINQPFFILRFVSGKAYHDLGKKWLSIEQKYRIIKLLEPHGKVFITTEREIEPELKKWQLKLPSEKIHHLMYYATMFIGDSQTMTSEAAILGTPAVKCNTFAHKLSVPNMLEDKYNLCYSYQPHEFEEMISKISTLLNEDNVKDHWKSRREEFLLNMINPTNFLLWFIENYPHSQKIMKENPDYQYHFK
ncbi:MAG: DUF354 domain-containing protein [Bacteroidales bacterium]|nr:DUF354 domain-containing protein [Bacteroidales bacterium]